MNVRSTNVKGFVHFCGDVRSGVEDGIGISVGSASTGSTAWLETVSDDTDGNLGIRAQGAGTITIGNSSNKVALGGSTRAFLMQTYTVDVTPPALAASTSVASTYTVTGLTTNCNIILTPRQPIQASYTYQGRCSTASELVITWNNNSGSSNSDSTNRMNVLAISY